MNKGTGVAVAAMVAVGAVGVGAVGVGAFGTGIAGTGIAAGATRAAAKQPTRHGTFQTYANVDQLGDLGSNVGAKSVDTVHGSQGSHSWNYYQVTFVRPIGSCAAQVQPGFAGGDLSAGFDTSLVDDIDAATFRVRFLDPGTNYPTSSAFMLTVTCPS